MVSGIKWNSVANTSSLDILSAASAMAVGIACNRKTCSGRALWRGYDNKAMSTGVSFITEKPNCFNIIRNENATVAAGVFTSICSGCLLSEAASSSITSSAVHVRGKRVGKSVKARSINKQPLMTVITRDIDQETCSNKSSGEVELTDWTDVEKAAFLHALSSYGKDFAMIAQYVGTKSQYQCRVLFSKTHKHNGMDLIGQRAEIVGLPGDDDVDGGRSDADNACIAETGSVNDSDTSGTKTGVDQLAYDKNAYHDESIPMETRNLQLT